MPTFVEVSEPLAIAAEPEGEMELVVGRTLLRVRGRVEAGALARVLDVLEARARGTPRAGHARRRHLHSPTVTVHANA